MSVVDAAAEAAVEAARVAARAGVEIRLLDGMAQIDEAMETFRAVWGFSDREAPISAELLRAFSFAGAYVAGAYADGTVVGASAGFLAERDGSVHLHSHISGVAPTWQGRHVGLALKQHQRAWSVERGIDAIEWTFDPLVRRNAYFNLVKLGASAVGFEANFYGVMRDSINVGDESDRTVVHWAVRSPDARAALEGALDRDDPSGSVVLVADDRGAPVVRESRDAVLRAWIPADIEATRRGDAGLARAWRHALRATFGGAVRDGYCGVSMSRDGWYTLVRP